MHEQYKLTAIITDIGITNSFTILRLLVIVMTEKTKRANSHWATNTDDDDDDNDLCQG